MAFHRAICCFVVGLMGVCSLATATEKEEEEKEAPQFYRGKDEDSVFSSPKPAALPPAPWELNHPSKQRRRTAHWGYNSRGEPINHYPTPPPTAPTYQPTTPTPTGFPTTYPDYDTCATCVAGGCEWCEFARLGECKCPSCNSLETSITNCAEADEDPLEDARNTWIIFAAASGGMMIFMIICCCVLVKRNSNNGTVTSVQIIPTNLNPQPVQMQTVTYGAGAQPVQVQNVPQQVQVFGANGQQQPQQAQVIGFQQQTQQVQVVAGPAQTNTTVVVSGAVTSTGQSMQQTILL